MGRYRLIIIVLIILLCIFVVAQLSGRDGVWACKDGLWAKEGNTSIPMPAASLCVDERLEILRGYLDNNLSTISLEKEVLGGKFYVTKISILSPDMAEVEYEDGHIALRARFNFLNKDGVVSVTNFVIIK